MLAERLGKIGLLVALPCTALASPPQRSTQIATNGQVIARNYPVEALRRGEQGKVDFRVDIDRDGAITSCEVTGSSGFPDLDRATCDLLVRSARQAPVTIDGRVRRAEKTGYINWRLPPGIKPSDAIVITKKRQSDRLTCKTSATTGSLVRKTKQCMTDKEWASAARIARQEAERLTTIWGVSRPCIQKANTEPC